MSCRADERLSQEQVAEYNKLLQAQARAHEQSLCATHCFRELRLELRVVGCDCACTRSRSSSCVGFTGVPSLQRLGQGYYKDQGCMGGCVKDSIKTKDTWVVVTGMWAKWGSGASHRKHR